MHSPEILPARAVDAAAIAPLMWQAMPEVVACWINSTDRLAGIAFLQHWIAQPANVYSHENALVCRDGAMITAVISGYNGADQDRLRAPIIAVHRPALALEAETDASEWYIDSLSVAPAMQGQGLGAALLAAFAAHARAQGGQRLGLLVDIRKTAAQRLYQRNGFIACGQKMLAGECYNHLVRALV